jgi:hypothetical protein
MKAIGVAAVVIGSIILWKTRNEKEPPTDDSKNSQN